MTPGRDEGFALVEVLVAFVILASTIVLSFQVFGDGLRRLAHVQQRITEVEVARSEMLRVFEPNKTGAPWTIRSVELHKAINGYQLFHVSIQIKGQDGQPPILETIVLRRQVQ